MKTVLLRLFLELFGLRPSKVPLEKSGLLMITLDGVSWRVIREAIRKGYCPNLKKFIKSQHVTFSKFISGLPSTTTAIEAELFYGKGNQIPGFSWFDRDFGEFMNGFDALQMKKLERKLAMGEPELLAGGSCILGMFGGGAALTSITAKDFGFGNPIRGIVKFRLVFLLFLHPVRFFSTLFIFWRQCIVSLMAVVRTHSVGEFYVTFEPTIVSLFFNDTASRVARIELLRDTPRLFVNFALYDHLAHIHGTRHPVAFSTLRIMDSYCGTLLATAKSRRRPYDIVIFSDHGQDDSVPFEKVKNETLPEVLGRVLGKRKEDIVFGTFLLDRNIKVGRVFALASGNIAHVYFSERMRDPYILENLEHQYPGAVPSLLAHSGIGWVLVRTARSDDSTLFGKNGSIMFSKGKVVRVVGKPLGSCEDSDEIRTNIALFALGKSLGDIVLFGDVLFGKSVSFEPFQGAHSGFTGEMMQAFMMTNIPTIGELLSKRSSMKTIFAAMRANL